MYAYPMDSIVTYAEDGTPQFDRAVDSSQLRELHHSLMTDGVLLKDSSNLQVSASSNMEIVVNPGLCNIQGCIKKFSEDTIITIASANATMSRIDTVVARLDLNSDYRDIGLFVIQGTPASVPTRPELTRNTSVYEIALADITISANATSITQANISDTRLDTNRCGIISSITQFDTTKLYKQIEADLIEFQESNETEFEVWFEHMKEQLGEDAAGNLQLQIDDVNEKATEHIENTANPHNVTAEQINCGETTVKGAIDELSDNVADVQTQINEVQNNVMGTYYDLIANGNTNPDTASYKCEYDGYLGISTGNVATRYGISDANNVGMYHSVNVPANQRALMYIKKGMRVYCEANTGTKCTFMPFIS